MNIFLITWTIFVSFGLGFTEKYNSPLVLKQFSYLPVLADFKKLNLFENVGGRCAEQTEYWLNELNRGNLLDIPTWALQMIDSWGKLPEGILRGHVSALGDFDECIAIRSENLGDSSTSGIAITGQYCSVGLVPSATLVNLTLGSVKIKLSNQPSASIIDLMKHINTPFEGGLSVSPAIGVCFPSMCSTVDVQVIISTLVRHFDMDAYFSPSVYSCSTSKEIIIGPAEIAMITVFAVLFLFIVVGTLLEHFSNKKDNGEEFREGKVAFLAQILLSFSLITNTRKLLSTKEEAGSLGCLHGIRFLTICWVVLGHTWYAVLSMQPIWNSIQARMLFTDGLPIFAILNFSTSVDTFFTIAGLLVAYNLLKALDSSKGKINIPMLYVHRYIRLTPAVAFMVGFTATLWPLLGSGPNWFIVDLLSGYCKKSWWMNLLYLNNLAGTAKDGAFGPDNAQCLGHAWYVATDMQYYLLSPILLYSIWKWKRIGLAFLTLLSLAAIIIPTMITYWEELLPTAIYREGNMKYQMDGYFRPWMRFGPYLIGIWTGLILHKTKGLSFKLSYATVTIGWFLSAATALAIVFGPYSFWNPDNVIPRISSAIYAGFHRNAWALSISWIIICCIKGYGGFVNEFLSWKLFMPLSRLTFCIYLVSWPLQMIYHLRIRQPQSYDAYSAVNVYFGHLMMSILVGIICTLTIESPFLALEKVLFSRKQRQPTESRRELNNNNNDYDTSSTRL